MEAVPYKHKLFVLGDFNARVGRDYKVSSKVTGRHGIGGENANGSILPDLCVKPTPSSNRPTSIKPVGSIRAPTIGILLITYLLGKSQDRVTNAPTSYALARCQALRRSCCKRISFDGSGMLYACQTTAFRNGYSLFSLLLKNVCKVDLFGVTKTL